ncbi:MAG TPA: TIGR01841 family phasin [Alphaproteobacteria bacterium]|nr:TIGR01841 family phasin [Alphaproteobacteria bacterium]
MARTNNSAENMQAEAFNNLSRYMPDMSAIMEVHRRNAEAFTRIGQQTFQDMQAMLSRQGEMLRDHWSSTTQMMGTLMNGASPQEKMNAPAELTRNAIEKAAANSRELMEMAAECQRRAAELVTARMNEAMEEFREACSRR